MRTAAKLGLVATGYGAAFAIASFVVAAYIAATNGPNRQTYGAMFAFGDTLLFLGVFTVAAVPATGAALFFLRPYRPFWLVLSVAALAIATSSVAAVLGKLASTVFGMRVNLQWLMAFGSLGIILAPLFAIVFTLSGFFAPNRATRASLIVAAAVEILTFVYWFDLFRIS